MNGYKLYTQLLEKDYNNRKLRKKHERQALAVITPKPKISSVVANLKTQFEYTCERCHKPIIYDTLFIDDFTGKYIPLDRETMRTHFRNCKSSCTIATLQSNLTGIKE